MTTAVELRDLATLGTNGRAREPQFRDLSQSFAVVGAWALAAYALVAGRLSRCES